MDATSLGGKSFLNASTIKSAGMTLYSTLTPAITTLGWRAISAAKDIDTAYRDMRKTVDGTEAQFKELREAAIEFSKTHVTSAEQILQIEAIGGEVVLRAVKLVTKEPGYEMQDYVSRILAHPMAKAVKTADRLHNLRSAHVCTDQFKARYIRESALWYAGLHPEIPIAIRALAGSVGEARLREELGKELELML